MTFYDFIEHIEALSVGMKLYMCTDKILDFSELQNLEELKNMSLWPLPWYIINKKNKNKK